ncbi:uncharacterized protein LOC123538124 isoform X2 [Mercenaria mercenaria]|uniref:uncharacterized protein LOC123538124 isoform X2 n=1 Tax=Mercenaria mercenaria TaxID=6596 RepID=UPI00234F0207|nr:uncharacterized protein LOC123538124 isoform X2 [Mercenaria mercenaria]
MRLLSFLSIFVNVVTLGYSTRCFECTHVQFPSDCTQLTDCNSDESCPAVSAPHDGRRSTSMVNKRSEDIITCLECCHGDFCNMNGCRSQEIPIAQRGPYCYTCDVLDPKACTNVNICGKNELCMLFSPTDFGSLSEIIYRGQCETKAACDAVSKAFVNTKCVPTCCNTDFCNDYCVTPTDVTMTSSYPNTTDNNMANTTFHPTELSTVTLLLTQSVSTTDVRRTGTSSKPSSHIFTTPGITQSSTTGHSFHCHVKDGFVHLQNSLAHLCVHVVLHHTPLSWNDARTACKAQGGDLVVLDTHDKALLMRKALAGHFRYSHPFYWIGAKDFSKHDHFSWVNGHGLHNTAADWSGDQPEHFKHGHDQDCVCMFRDTTPTFTWHDKFCNLKGNYICERK